MQIIKVGKAESNDIYKDFRNDPTVSRFHCEIFIDDENNAFITDLDSTNGTFVNGNKISESVKLGNLDIIRAGNSLVKWKEYVMSSNVDNDLEEEDSMLYQSDIDNPPKKMNYWWLIIVIILLFLLIKQCGNQQERKRDDRIEIDNLQEEKTHDVIQNKTIPKFCPTPSSGFSPYNSEFGFGVYSKNSGNEFIIKNTQSTHAVILLVNAYTNKKIRNEFIKKGETFTMTDVPNGTYFARWVSGNDWCPDIKMGHLTGSFQTDLSFAEASDRKDWMSVGIGDPNYYQWTLTLYAVSGGDVSITPIDENNFINK